MRQKLSLLALVFLVLAALTGCAPPRATFGGPVTPTPLVVCVWCYTAQNVPEPCVGYTGQNEYHRVCTKEEGCPLYEEVCEETLWFREGCTEVLVQVDTVKKCGIVRIDPLIGIETKSPSGAQRVEYVGVDVAWWHSLKPHLIAGLTLGNVNLEHFIRIEDGWVRPVEPNLPLVGDPLEEANDPVLALSSTPPPTRTPTPTPTPTTANPATPTLSPTPTPMPATLTSTATPNPTAAEVPTNTPTIVPTPTPSPVPPTATPLPTVTTIPLQSGCTHLLTGTFYEHQECSPSYQCCSGEWVPKKACGECTATKL